MIPVRKIKKNVEFYRFYVELEENELTVQLLTFEGDPNRYVGRYTPENIPR